tara:strand:- start:302 stop:562 length:261 start_codon:yes stop_codon:yes gene_type:complete
MDYTITLTDVEKDSMDYITKDIDDWITNAAKNRARKAKNEIISLNTAHCNANGISIAVGEAAQVAQAYSLGVVKTAADVEKETEVK